MGKARHSLFGRGGKDPRDKTGLNPTGRPTRSSAKKRRQSQRRLERDLQGTRWEDSPYED